MGSPFIFARAFHSMPRSGAWTCVASKGYQLPPSLMEPCMVSRAARHRGVPGAMAWVSQRRAGGGSPSSMSGRKVSWGAGVASRRSATARSPRESDGAGGGGVVSVASMGPPFLYRPAESVSRSIADADLQSETWSRT